MDVALRAYLDRLMQVLGGRRLHDGSLLVRCPAHDDHEPSLHVTIAEDKTLFHCFAGCTFEQIKAALERIGLYESGVTTIAKAIYIYEDELGTSLFRKIRYEPKTFRIEHKEGDYWAAGLKGTRKVLYRLPEVLRAQEVWVVEGEKDVETLRKYGVVATTNPMGAAEEIGPEYVGPLMGKDVVLLPDQDDAGKKLAAKWSEALRLTAKTLRVLDLPEGKDVTEFLEKHSFEELRELVEKKALHIKGGKIEYVLSFSYGCLSVRVENLGLEYRLLPLKESSERLIAEAALFNPEGSKVWDTRTNFANDFNRARVGSSLERLYPLGSWGAIVEGAYLQLRRELSGMEAEEEPEGPDWFLQPFVSGAGINILYGPMGHFKSFLVQACALSISEGELLVPYGELFTTGRVLWLDFENVGEKQLMRRAVQILGREPKDFIVRAPESPLGSCFHEVVSLLKEFDPSLLIIDSLGPAVGDDLVAAGSAFGFYSVLRHLRVPILIVAHPPKNKPDTVIGSSFFQNLARNIWSVEKIYELEGQMWLNLHHEKFSFGPRYKTLGLEVDFSGETLVLRPCEALFSQRSFTTGSATARILSYLRFLSDREVSFKELERVCGLNSNLVEVAVRDLEKRGLVSRNGKACKLKALLAGKKEEEDLAPF